MADSIRSTRWEAGASHAEQGLRPTTSVFVIIEGLHGHGDFLGERTADWLDEHAVIDAREFILDEFIALGIGLQDMD